MRNLALAVILADQGRSQCPCGAVADRPFGQCRKCQNRKAWRRKTNHVHRKTNRRTTGRRRFGGRIHNIGLDA